MLKVPEDELFFYCGKNTSKTGRPINRTMEILRGECGNDFPKIEQNGTGISQETATVSFGTVIGLCVHV